MDTFAAAAAKVSGKVGRWNFRVDWILLRLACWWPLMVASVILPYLDICWAVSSGHESRLRFWTAFIQVVRTGENRVAW